GEMEDLKERFEGEPYCRELGVVVEAVEEGRARVRLPYDDKNSNPGRALHGGVAASMIDIAGSLAACAGFDDAGAMETGALDVAVNYLAAAIGEEIFAEARVLRRGKEITYCDVDVSTAQGKAIAKGLVTHRAVPVTTEARVFAGRADPDALAPAEVSQLGRAFMKVPFIGRLGMRNERMQDGTARVRLPFLEANAASGGAVHEGAIIALIDTTGAMASWSIVGLDFSFKASTVAVHANFAAPAVGEDLVSLARTLRKNEEIFWNEVTVAGAKSGKLVAHGDVVYRIVVPK
ncbi:MAG: PaaI family thioesterase, partial [Candidatus Binatia bacterium]